MSNQQRPQSKHFFAREPDGTVRLRIRFDGEEASLYEEAAGDTPLMLWIHRTLGEAARRQVAEQRRTKKKLPPPIH